MSLHPGNDFLEMVTDQSGNRLYVLDSGVRHNSAPSPGHGGSHVDLLALNDLAQLLAVRPHVHSPLRGEFGEQVVDFRATGVAEAFVIAQQFSVKILEATWRCARTTGSRPMPWKCRQIHGTCRN